MQSLAPCSHLGRKVQVRAARCSTPPSLSTFPSHQGSPARFAGPSPGWKTKIHKRYTSKDRQLLRILETTAVGGNTKARELKRHTLCDGLMTFILSGRSVFRPPASLFLTFCGTAGSSQSLSEHAYTPTLRGKHGHAPQVLQQRKFLRFAQDTRRGTAL